MALTTDKLDQSVSSELPGNPPLWIARRDASSYQYDLYINDARVIRGDIKAMSTRQDEQVRLIIFRIFSKSKANKNTFYLLDFFCGVTPTAVRRHQNDHFLFHQTHLRPFQHGIPFVYCISFP